MLDNDAKAVIALTTRLGARERPSLSPRAWHRLVDTLSDSGLIPADLFDTSIDLRRAPWSGSGNGKQDR